MYCDIPYDSLSQTHKDAVLVSATLGIHFLWIDALCIIQNKDDPKDWVEQSAEMHKIYGNAYLCIAAANACSAGEGFLSKRRPFEVPQVFKGSSSVVHGRDAFDHSEFTYGDEFENMENHNPLQKRRWCFQEYVLSRRVLHFGYEEMFYECKEASNCECGMFPGPFQSQLPTSAYRAFLGKVSTIEEKALNKGWLSFLEDFSGRDFTYLSDRLPSISGIAKFVQSRFGVSYLAGHWRGEDFLESLCWNVIAYRPKSLSSDWACFRGPTWSWASVEGGFTQPDWAFQKLNGTEILEASTILRTSDPTGAVSSGILRIKGVFLNAEVCRDNPRYSNAIGRNGAASIFWPDYELKFDETESRLVVLCWYVGTATNTGTDKEEDIDWINNAQLIVLRQRDRSLQLYERIGSGRVYLEDEGTLEGWDQCWNTVTVV
jgi:hypothetical protein